MRIDCGIVTILNVHLVIALPHGSYVRPGVGDMLIQRIAPHYPTMPIMLLDNDRVPMRAYAPFDTDPFLKKLDLAAITFKEIDLDSAIPIDDALPF